MSWGQRACVVAFSLTTSFALAAPTQLYDTGPAEDAAFVRFVNAGDPTMEVRGKGSDNRIELTANHPVSDFMAVRGGSPMQGEWTRAGQRHAIELVVQPGEFVSVIGLTGNAEQATAVVRETPDDFNAAKVSIGFYNLDPACAHAGLMMAPKGVAIFNDVPHGQAVRRFANPVALRVKASCSGQTQEQTLDMGTLQAGERVTVFLLPSAKGPKLLFAVDQVGR